MGERYSESEIERVRQSTKISDVIGRFVKWDKRKSNFSRGDHWACCPFHGEKTPSFHCEDHKGRYHCFGCGVSGDHFKFLMEIGNLSFTDAVAELGGTASKIDPEREAELKKKREADLEAAKQLQEESNLKRIRTARALFKLGKPLAGTLGEKYLLSRSIPEQEWDHDRVRFLPKTKYDLKQGVELPALVAAVTNVKDEITAIWRIYLNPETGEKAEIYDGDLKLSAKVGKGVAAGASVRLGVNNSRSEILVTEGLETGYAVLALTGNKFQVWAGLSTAGMAKLDIPDHIKSVGPYCDYDSPRFKQDSTELAPEPGRAAGLELVRRAKEMGKETSFHMPMAIGSDWLNVWESIHNE